MEGYFYKESMESFDREEKSRFLFVPDERIVIGFDTPKKIDRVKACLCGRVLKEEKCQKLKRILEKQIPGYEHIALDKKRALSKEESDLVKIIALEYRNTQITDKSAELIDAAVKKLFKIGLVLYSSYL